MPAFNVLEMLTWLHVVAMATFGGAAITALLLSGLEEAQPEYRGLAATIWSKVACWGARLALLFGIALLVFKLKDQYPVFAARAFHFKLLTAIAMVGLAEAAPRALARGKRGAALLAVVCFLLTSFLALNKSPFGFTQPKAAPAAPAMVQPAP